jgi:carboxypeptidase family protein/TonB-dependent receptor-like protein
LASPSIRSGSHTCDRLKRVPFLLLLVLILGASPSLAQVTSSSILGYVYDPSGAVIIDAGITVFDARHSVIRETTTDSSGAYIVVGLAPAQYSVSASAPNFAEVTQPQVTLEVNSQLRVDFHLALAATLKTIEVASRVSPLQTESADLATVVNQQQIESLPLNRRDFLQLALLSPGVLPPVEGSELSTRGSFSMHSGGGREEFNDFLLDGADNNDPYVNRYGVEPPVDSIQEFKVATSSYSAEYGRSAAGQVNVITRQGTNNFHGSTYEYLRNKVLDARNFFDGSDKPNLIRNQFGLSGGGPIIREKTFFFAATDFLRRREGQSQLATVPTLDERAGNLSVLCQTGFTNGVCNAAPPNSNLSAVQIYDPFTQQPFSGNIIPGNRISALAQDVLQLYPKPNLPGVSGNFLGNPILTENDTQGTFRVDHHLLPSAALNFRYSFGRIDLFEPYLGGSVTVPGFGDYLRDHIQNAGIQYQQYIGSRATNSLRFAYNRFARDLLPQNYNVDVGKLWNVNWLNVPPIAFGYPALNVTGFASMGDNFSLPIVRTTNTFQLADSLSLERGPHLFKLGGEVRALQLNGILDLLNRGSLSFFGGLSGAGLSDLLLGLPNLGIQVQANNPLAMRTKAFDGYFEDGWRVSHRLTLTLGMRYEFNTPAIDPRNGMSTLDFQTGQVVQVGTNGISRSGVSPDHNDFAPRLGIAWSPAESWVVRSGYGIYYEAGMFVVNSSQYFNPPEFNLRVFFPSAAGLLTLDNPFPSSSGFTPPPSLSILNRALVTPYLQQWNLTVERSLQSWGTVSVGYAGSKGTKLIRAFDLNQPLPAPGDLQSRRTFSSYGNIFDIESGANSSFHSLQALYNKTMGSHYSLWLAYTYSKSIDDASAFLGIQPDPNFPQNSHDLNAERAASSFDMRHRFVAAYMVQLPKGNRWTRNTEFRGITTVETGQPFTPIISFDNSNTGNTGGSAGSDRPNIVGNPRTGSCPNPNGGAPIPVGGPDCWFNVSAFQIAPPFHFGDAGRNILRGPGLASFDLSLYRNFHLSERFTFACEAEAFNLFNRANFNLPQNFADSPNTFGKIFSAKAPRQVQMALRLSF